MDVFICPEIRPKKWGSNTAMVTQRLAALRSHGSRFWDLRKRLNPTSLPVLENTCPQPISVQERLSPRPLVKNKKKEKQTEMIPITHPLEMRTNGQTDGRMDSQCLAVLHRPRFPGWESILSIPTGNHIFLLSFQTKCDFAMIAH